MADALKESGMDLIREYIPDSPVYNPEDEPGQYNLPYVPHSPVYRPPSPDYTPSAITSVPELSEPEEGTHNKFANPPASLPPNGDVSMDVSSNGSTQLHTASVHPTSDAAIILHPEPSGPPQGMPVPVHISRAYLQSKCQTLTWMKSCSIKTILLKTLLKKWESVQMKMNQTYHHR